MHISPWSTTAMSLELLFWKASRPILISHFADIFIVVYKIQVAVNLIVG